MFARLNTCLLSYGFHIDWSCLTSNLGLQGLLLLSTFTTLWADSIDDKLMMYYLFFPENRLWSVSKIHFKMSSAELLFRMQFTTCMHEKGFFFLSALTFQKTVVVVVRIFHPTWHPRHIEAVAIVMYMYLYSLAFMDHSCTLGGAVCHQEPPCPLYTQPRACRVWARHTNGLKIVSAWSGFEPTISRLKVMHH